MLRAKYLSAQGKHQEAVDRLLPALERAPMNIRLYRQILDHLMDARNGQYILEIAKQPFLVLESILSCSIT